jgi:hypothetical protein
MSGVFLLGSAGVSLVDEIGCARRDLYLAWRFIVALGRNDTKPSGLSFVRYSFTLLLPRGAAMDREISRLKQNVARLRRDIRLQAWELQQLIDSDLDCTGCAQRLVRMQADLVLVIAKRERLNSPQTA